MDDFNLSDFLTAASGAYTGYENSQTTADAAKTAQANAAAQATLLANQNAMSAQTKSWLLIGGAVLIAVVLVIMVLKKK